MDLEFIASVEKMNRFQFGFHSGLFLICHILKRSTVLAQIKPYQLHDTFSADNIPTEMTNHVYYFL